MSSHFLKRPLLTESQIAQFLMSVKMSSPLEGTVSHMRFGIDPAELDEINDYMTGQNSIKKTLAICKEECSTITEMMGQLKNYLIQLEDPLDYKILDLIKDISAMIGDHRKDFFYKYRHLVRLSGDDMPQLRDELILACTSPPATLIFMLKISIVAYSAALTRNNKDQIAEIDAATTNLSIISANISAQQEDFKKFAEHTALAWNATAASMTSFIAGLNKKNLELSYPSTSPRVIPKSPTTSSVHTPDHAVGTTLTLLPGSLHKS